jgi:hypothetical protein
MTIRCLLIVTAVSVGMLSFETAAEADLTVDTNFSGGSAKVEKIDQAEKLIKLTPFPHPGRGWACWWYCMVRGATPGKAISLDVGQAPWATPDRATYSYDQQSWQHTSPGKRSGNRIVYQLTPSAPQFWIAWGPPFLPSDARDLVESASQHPFATAIELCRTREGRSTPALIVTECDDSTERYGVWIQARQHAWESGSSWVAKGLVDWLISDHESARSLRRKTRITIVPIMDIDNVDRGAGGKNQKPQDHNRDWSATPHWNSVAAAQQAISDQDKAGQFDLFIDLHNPGANDRQPYYYVPPQDLLSATGRRNLQRFITTSKTEITGPLRFAGKIVESGSQYDPKAWEAISKNWVAMHCGEHVVAVTLETAWNTPKSTTAGYQQIGRELGNTLDQYFRREVRKPVVAEDRP